jgi:hypothetical protein
VYAWEWDLPPSNEAWSHAATSGASGVLICEPFFPFFLWLLVSLLVDLEKVLPLTGYGCLLGSSEIHFSG